MQVNTAHAVAWMHGYLQTEKMIRDLAVKIVDERHGCTAEFATNPEAHRAEYAEEDARIRREIAYLLLMESSDDTERITGYADYARKVIGESNG